MASLVSPILVPGDSPTGHEAAGGDREATPNGRVWPCADEWHPAFRHAPAAGPWACSCSTTSARPGAACAAIAGRVVPVARAPLRGAATHEAKGRGVAWSGGAGLVGPPPGWHRLRLLRQIGDQLVSGVEQFLLINNVVAVEDGAALVPGQEHGDPLGDVRADQVAGGGAAAIVEEAGRHPGRLAGGAPRRAPAPDRVPIAVEHCP